MFRFSKYKPIYDYAVIIFHFKQLPFCDKAYTNRNDKRGLPCVTSFVYFLLMLTLCLLVSSADTQLQIANSLDSDQAWQNVGPDLDPNCLTFKLLVFLKEFFK